jgi:N-acetylmuramoyl-L-alanine amidase
MIIALLWAFNLEAATPQPKKQSKNPKPLAGLVLVLDPGHGGKDPGSHGVFKSQNVFEALYTFDQADRIRYFAEQRGAKVYMTITGDEVTSYRNWPASKIFENTKDGYFTLDDTQVVAGKSGLNKRVEFANGIARKNRGKKVVFLAIHFDSASKAATGAFVITPHNYKPAIADFMVGSLNGLAASVPLRTAGKGGEKNLQILRDGNSIRQKVLIELGNFQNEKDNWRIRDYQTRNKFAIRIVEGLQKYAVKK